MAATGSYIATECPKQLIVTKIFVFLTMYSDFTTFLFKLNDKICLIEQCFHNDIFLCTKTM